MEIRRPYQDPPIQASCHREIKERHLTLEGTCIPRTLSWYRLHPRELYLQAQSAQEASPRGQLVDREADHPHDRRPGSLECPCLAHLLAHLRLRPVLRVQVVRRTDSPGTCMHQPLGPRLGKHRIWALLWDQSRLLLQAGLIRLVMKPTRQQTQQGLEAR
jgi:hypothetical protein